MHMEVGAFFGRFVWRGINIDDVAADTEPSLADSSGAELTSMTSLPTQIREI